MHKTEPTEPTGFRRWRRSRPFWGGLLAILGGAELLAIPLAPLGIVVLQGMSPWLAGIVLILAGVLVWVQPQQRFFFGLIAMLAALASLITSNLGGFGLGMTLGLLGGGLIFAWTPGHAQQDKQPREIVPGLAQELEA
ncbi:hypothetical protein GCM10027589_40310 [Actinocorallia lasiicapitis]